MFFAYMMFFALALTLHFFYLNYTLYYKIYIYMIYILLIFFIHFFPVIMLNACIFKSFVSFGTHTLLDKSLRELQLPTHLSNLTANGY